MLTCFFLITEWSLTQVSKKCRMIKVLFRSLPRREPVCRTGQGSEMKLEMMSRHRGITSCFSQTKQTRTAENSAVKSFLLCLEVSLVCLFGRTCDRVHTPFLCEVIENYDNEKAFFYGTGLFWEASDIFVTLYSKEGQDLILGSEFLV